MGITWPTYNIDDTFIIGFDFSRHTDTPVMTIGKKYDGRIDIIHTITGMEAIDMYYRLHGNRLPL